MRELTSGQWFCEFEGFPGKEFDEYLDKHPRATDDICHCQPSVHRSCDFREAPEIRSPSCVTPEMPPEFHRRRRRRNSSRGAPRASAPEASAHALRLGVAPLTPPRFGEEGDYDFYDAVDEGPRENGLAAIW